MELYAFGILTEFTFSLRARCFVFTSYVVEIDEPLRVARVLGKDPLADAVPLSQDVMVQNENKSSGRGAATPQCPVDVRVGVLSETKEGEKLASDFLKLYGFSQPDCPTAHKLVENIMLLYKIDFT